MFLILIVNGSDFQIRSGLIEFIVVELCGKLEVEMLVESRELLL